MVNVYLVRHDKYRIGVYNYGNIYFNKQWANIECKREMLIDTDNGMVDSKSDLKVFHMPSINDRYWLFIVEDSNSDNMDDTFVNLYSSLLEAENIQRLFVDKGYFVKHPRIDMDKFSYIVEKLVVTEMPNSYEDSRVTINGK